MHRSVLVPFGTRPEAVKVAPVVRALKAAGHDVHVVDTGQHTDWVMSGQIQEELGLAASVRHTLPVEPAARYGALYANAASDVASVRPDVVLALGDTNTVPAYALAARAAGVPFGHMEAGLRSFNLRSIEEVNRRVAAAASQLHFAPTSRSREFLLSEGVSSDRIFVVGNPVVDTLVERALPAVSVAERSGVLVTAHRASNVDDVDRLKRLVTLVSTLADEVGEVTFPVHPRTRKQLVLHGLWDTLADVPGVSLSDPLGYDALLDVLRRSKVVVTDSGGVQEEAAFYGVPVALLRRSTPRWEGVEVGSTVLGGLTSDLEAESVLAAALRLTGPAEQTRIAALPCPYGDGTTGEQIAQILSTSATSALLELVEPDFTAGGRPW